MSRTLPTPVAAAIGVVPTVLGGVRRLPVKVLHLPLHAVSSALTTIDRTRREYDALADRGERLVARLRGVSFDELEDRFEDRLEGTPLARPYDAVEDALEDAAEGVTSLARKAAEKAAEAASSTTAAAGSAVDSAADSVSEAATAVAGATEQAVESATETVTDAAAAAEQAVESAAGTVTDVADEAGTVADKAAGQASDTVQEALPVDDGAKDDEAPKGEATPKATQPDTTRIDTAASADVVETVERVTDTVRGPVLEHDQLPLPDYDHMTLGSLRGRMRSLDLPQLVQIRNYEKAHADRLPIVTMLDNRIAKLASDPTAPLSGGSSRAKDMAKPRKSSGGSKVSPATSGPAQNPPSQGVPTNPAQPR